MRAWSIGRWVSEWKATTRMKAPSSARMLSGTRSAMRSSTAGWARTMLSTAARLRRMVTRVAWSGGLDVGDEAGLEALTEPLLDRDERSRETVAREHELPPGLIQGVERVEELLLGAGLAGEELDVVDEQDVGVAVGVLEGVDRLGAQRADEVVGEGLGGGVADGGTTAVVQDVVADGMEEVGLAEAGRGVEEEGVVGLAGELGDGEGGGVGQAVALADDELLESVAGVELGRCAVGPEAPGSGLDGAALPRRRRRRGCGCPGSAARSARARVRSARRATSPWPGEPGA